MSPALDQARRSGMQTVALAHGAGSTVTALGNADLAVTGFSMVAKLGAGADSKY